MILHPRLSESAPTTSAPSAPVSAPVPSTSTSTVEADKESAEGKEEEDPAAPAEPKGDPEMVPVYVRALLPMFCLCFQSTMIPSIKRSSLALVKKILHYTTADLLTEVSRDNRHLVGEVVEVMTSVLDQEDDDEGHLTCLLVVQDLMTKDSEGAFLEQFAKLGLFQKVHALTFSDDGGASADTGSAPGSAGSTSPVGEILTPTSAAAAISAATRQDSHDGAAGASSSSPAPAPAPPKEDAKEVVSGKGYTWRDWSIARGRDCLYIWSDAAALELSNGSNGWFR